MGVNVAMLCFAAIIRKNSFGKTETDFKTLRNKVIGSKKHITNDIHKIKKQKK